MIIICLDDLQFAEVTKNKDIIEYFTKMGYYCNLDYIAISFDSVAYIYIYTVWV